jgi:D-alanyl-D-alanine carboxypeptidase (penicillin-binding protein 5/6)
MRRGPFRLAATAKIFFFPRMIFARRCALAILLVTAPAAMLAASARKKAAHPDSAGAFKGAIVIDAATGNVLFEDRADTVTPPASMTKLMTFAVLHDKLASGSIALDTPVKITVEDAKMGGTQVFLDSRETFPVEELMYAMMIQSANDAAHALARAAAGSVPAFVELMNAKAKELGMANTTFRTPHGLPPKGRKIADGDLTTPRDFAVLSRYLLQKTDVLKYTSVLNRDFAPNRQFGETQHMKNHNNLLGKVAGVDGLKTGYTEGAGYCLSATAQRNGRRVIAVIMGSFGPNGQIDKGKARDLKTVELLEQGFAKLPPAPATPMVAAAPAGSPIAPAPKPATPPATEAAPDGEQPLKFSVPKKK